ncbi:MAG: glycosyltransferase family 4 protein [Candidatus Bathyarchaeia archaeon]
MSGTLLMDQGVMNKVLIISERWWPDGTGGILASHFIAGLLQGAGFKLTVVHGTKEPIRLNGIRYVYSSLLSVRDKHRLWLNCSILARKHWFRELISRSDVVYIPRYCYPLIPVAKRFGKRVVVHLHDYQPVSYNSIVFSEQTMRSRVNAISFETLEHGSIARALLAGFTSPMNRLCRIWLREADGMICVSRRQAEIIGNMAPELASKLRVIYNPLPDIHPVKKSLDDPTFLYLGGDSYVKGFHVLLKASWKLLKKDPHVKFLLTQRFKNPTVSAIKRLGKAYNLLGHLKYEKVLKLHSITHALLFPSIWEEPLPYAVMESMVVGTLPIASKIGGVPEILAGTPAEGLMCEPNNVEGFAEHMEYVLSMDQEQLKDIGLSLREAMLKRFNHESIRNELMKAFLG